jgi:hypothetical protein
VRCSLLLPRSPSSRALLSRSDPVRGLVDLRQIFVRRSHGRTFLRRSKNAQHTYAVAPGRHHRHSLVEGIGFLRTSLLGKRELWLEQRGSTVAVKPRSSQRRLSGDICAIERAP